MSALNLYQIANEFPGSDASVQGYESSIAEINSQTPSDFSGSTRTGFQPRVSEKSPVVNLPSCNDQISEEVEESPTVIPPSPKSGDSMEDDLRRSKAHWAAHGESVSKVLESLGLDKNGNELTPLCDRLVDVPIMAANGSDVHLSESQIKEMIRPWVNKASLCLFAYLFQNLTSNGPPEVRQEFARCLKPTLDQLADEVSRQGQDLLAMSPDELFKCLQENNFLIKLLKSVMDNPVVKNIITNQLAWILSTLAAPDKFVMDLQLDGKQFRLHRDSELDPDCLYSVNEDGSETFVTEIPRHLAAPLVNEAKRTASDRSIDTFIYLQDSKGNVAEKKEALTEMLMGDYRAAAKSLAEENAIQNE